MFCVIYRFPTSAEKEEQFKSAWRNLTEVLKAENGALGSRLHRNYDGDWIAYAQWPDEQTWASADNNSLEATKYRQMIRDSFVEGKSVEVLYKLNVVDDLLDRS